MRVNIVKGGPGFREPACPQVMGDKGRMHTAPADNTLQPELKVRMVRAAQDKSPGNGSSHGAVCKRTIIGQGPGIKLLFQEIQPGIKGRQLGEMVDDRVGQRTAGKERTGGVVFLLEK